MRRLFHNQHGDSLLILRAIACLLVIGSHVQRAELHTDTLKLPFAWVWVVNGHFGVWIFFILSGYLMGKGFISRKYILSGKGLFNYYRRRFLKIYVPYIATAFVLLFVYRSSLLGDPGTFADILLLRGDRVYGVDEISYLWAVSVIVLWYVIAPLVYRVFGLFSGKKNSTLVLGIAIVVAGQILRRIYLNWHPVSTFPEFNTSLYIHFLPNLDFFLMGAWVNLLQKSIPEDLQKKGKTLNTPVSYFPIIGLLTAYFIATYYIAAVYRWQTWVFVPYGTIGAFVCLLSVVLFIYIAEKTNGFPKPTININRLVLKPLVIVGTSSYFLYLFQSPMIKFLHLECKEYWCLLPTVWYRSLVVICLGLVISFLIRRISVPLYTPHH